MNAARIPALGDGGRARPTVRTHWPDLVFGLGVAAYGAENYLSLYGLGIGSVYRGGPLLLAAAAAAGLFRVAPGTALGLMWLSTMLQLAASLPVMQVQIVAVAVAYGAARYGSPAVLWLSGASVPLGAVAALLVSRDFGVQRVGFLPRVIPMSEAMARTGLPVIAVAFLATLAVPWLLGLLQRVRDIARRDQVRAEARQARAETERAQAQEIAALREGQAQLARDVHDVVGHSLAVILVQAESAQFLDQADTEAVRRTMENIAASARQSLRDVRQVLASTGEESGPGALPSGSLDGLLEGIRSAGHPVESTVWGVAQPLPPDLDTVAFRVLQEMLTNALKHGRRGEPVFVERQWRGELRMEVRNLVADGTLWSSAGDGDGDGPEGGFGMDGMRRRLDAVGGRLAVRCEEDGELGGLVFTATAWMPLRTGVAV